MRSRVLRIFIVTPASPETTGNSITADRWGSLLRRMGHDVSLSSEWYGNDCDTLIALHAARSHSSIERFRNTFTSKPLIVALTGTDIYRDIRTGTDARRSLMIASHIVALQPAALLELDESLRAKARVIYQSAVPPSKREAPADHYFDVCVLSHLRNVKDPLRAALAARELPATSRIRVIHAGRALETQWKEAAEVEQQANLRYLWIGEQSHEAALQLLARSRLFVLSSMMEGGANSIAEAVVCGVPVLCSDVPGNTGMLGDDYRGYFRLYDTVGLRDLLIRVETDTVFLESLQEWIKKLQPRFSPEAEMNEWNRLLSDCP